jgi:hypothetical protein
MTNDPSGLGRGQLPAGSTEFKETFFSCTLFLLFKFTLNESFQRPSKTNICREPVIGL